MTGRSFFVDRATFHAAATLAAFALLATPARYGRADVVPLGDVTPTNLGTTYQFGGTVAEGTIIIGGTGQGVGGTSTGQMTIDIPSDTDPLIADIGIIGGNIFGLGLATVNGLNSEWDLNNLLTVGSEGQGSLEVMAGARVVTAANKISTTPITLNPIPTGDTLTGGYDYIMGQWEGSQGFSTVDGFASLLLTGHATIGRRGFGRVDVTAGGRFVTVGRASIGELDDPANNGLGEGYVLVNGQRSKWTIGLTKTSNPNNAVPPDSINGTLFVGREGRGTLEISDQGAVRVETDAFLGGTGASSPTTNRAYGRVSVSGANSEIQVLNEMFVGDSTGATVGELYLADQGLARVDGGSGTSPAGGTTVGPKGLVDMAGGTILTPRITNNGVMRGWGTVDSGTLTGTAVTNNGDIRNAASIANERERLLFRGAVNNTTTGIIESIGGEMEFQGTVTNDGLIFGKDAILRFKNNTLPLTGSGQMKLDNTIVEETANIPIPVQALTLLPSQSQILGSIDLGDLDVTLGNAFSQLVVTGDAILGGTLDISLGSGYTPKIGDSFEILNAASRSGVFTALVGTVGPGGFWNASYTATSVFLNFAATGGPVFASDFNNDGMVNATDLVVWQTHLGMMPATAADGDANGDGKVDGADFLIWQSQNGSTFPAVPAAGAVPEPSTVVLALTVLAAFRRKRPS